MACLKPPACSRLLVMQLSRFAESQGYAPEGLEPSVDGLGGPVRAVLPVEEREDVAHAPPRIAVSSSAASER